MSIRPSSSRVAHAAEPGEELLAAPPGRAAAPIGKSAAEDELRHARRRRRATLATVIEITAANETYAPESAPAGGWQAPAPPHRPRVRRAAAIVLGRLHASRVRDARAA